MRGHYEPRNEEGSIRPTEADKGRVVREGSRGRRKGMEGGVVTGDPGTSSRCLIQNSVTVKDGARRHATDAG